MFSADLGGYTPSLPAATDPPFQKVALLLHGDGTNGSQNNTFVDYSYPGGYAVSFDGTGDYLSGSNNAPVNFGTGDFTVEAWVFMTANASGNYNMIFASSGLNMYFGVVYYGTAPAYRLTAYDGTTILEQSSGSSFTINAWNHVAWVRSGTTFKAYLNGVSVYSTTNSKNITGTTGFNIGKSPSYAGYQWNGFISNFRAVVGAAIYTSDFTPSNQPLTAVSGTQLLTCQSATIVDNSPNAFTITANGNAAAVSSKTITRTGNVAQGTFSPFSLADGQWSNYFTAANATNYLTTSGFGTLTGSSTKECFVYLQSYPNSYNNYFKPIFRFNGSDFHNIQFYGGFFGTGSPGSFRISVSQSTIPLNQWVHIAHVFNGTTETLYVNGVAVGTTTATANSGGTLQIGGANDGQSWDGYISNVRFVVGTAVYTSNFTPPTSALTAITNTSLLTCQSNRFKDNSSNNFTITPAGDTKVTAFSPFAPSAAYSAATNGGSGYFDGSGDYLTVASNAAFDQNSSNWTIESWVYLTAPVNASNGTCVVGQETNNYLKLSISKSGVAIIDQAAAGVKVTGTTVLKLNTWYHLAAVRNSNTVTLFVNGISEGTPATITSYAASANTMYIAKRPDTADSLSGYISNLRIVKGTAVYTTNFTPPTAPLTAVTNTQLLLNCTNAGIIDNAGKNDIETVGNAQVSTSVKKYGTGSMYFDGTGDYLKMPSNEALKRDGDFTVEAWVYPTSVSSDRAVAGMYVSGVGGWVFYISGGYLWFSSGFNNYSSTGVCVSANQWQHIAAVISNGNLYLFVDGVQKNTTTNVSASNWSILRPLVVGSTDNGSIWPFIGYIDDLRITKGQALYTSNFTPPTQAFPNV